MDHEIIDLHHHQIQHPGQPIKLKIKTFLLNLKRNKLHQAKNEKLVLTGLTITLGFFGVHRLYLGTEPHVPVLYTITLGGGLYVIPLIDLIHVLANKDLEKYRDNSHFIMWGSDKDE